MYASRHSALPFAAAIALIGAMVATTGQANAAPAEAITASDLVYSTQEKLGFSIQAYLARHAPHLSRQAEAISHWAGYSRISPKVLIALMEQESGIVSRKRLSLDTAQRPFGDLSPKRGFNSQLRDVAQRLKAIAVAEHRLARSGMPGFVPIDPIQALYAKSGRSQGAAMAAGRLQFANTYARLFGEPWGAAAKPDILDARAADAVPSATLLRLPYANNEVWRSGFPHSDTGSEAAMSSLDFFPTAISSARVRASARGVFKVHSACYAEILHENGWSTHYYHLDGIRLRNQALVHRGDWIASLASSRTQGLCDRGNLGGMHLHWALTRDGIESSLDGVTVSGYRMKILSTTNYVNDCGSNALTKGTSDWCFGETLKNTL